ncbi:MAG: transporter substrate-binding domain-containing protein [Paludibacteraceae bacterium]|nr:transporter substrate-binding domain-containing protein [Paludibacteraceae bacterium]
MTSRQFIIMTVVSLVALCSCAKKEEQRKVRDYDSIVASDTLRAATLYGSSTYFILQDEPFGFDYELLNKFADEKSLKLSLTIANSVSELTALLDSGKVDLIACRLPVTNEYKQKYCYADNVYITRQVLVQRSGADELTNVVQLLGKEVYVNEGSKYEQRLRNMNEELGGGIIIRTVSDTVSDDDLIEMVSKDSIDYAVVENDIAMLNKTYYQNIDCKLAVSFPQRSAWAVRKDCPQLLDSINGWLGKDVKRSNYNELYNKYFTKAKFFGDQKVVIPRGAISPYDDLFKKYAKGTPWDWRLLAAIAYEESRFDPTVVSWLGARGIMQVMPSVARRLGYSVDRISEPETSIEVGVVLLKRLDRFFASVPDESERLKFILASYNAGHSHVVDAMNLATKYGYDPHIWYGNVEHFLLLESVHEYYTDPVVKSGYFRAEGTVRYIEKVLSTYCKYMLRRK